MRTTKPKTHFEGKRSGSTGPEIAVVLKHNLKHPIFREAAKKQNLFEGHKSHFCGSVQEKVGQNGEAGV